MGLKHGIGFVVAVGISCFGCCPSEGGSWETSTVETEASVLPSIATEGMLVAQDLFATVTDCEVYHRGAFIDLGTSASQGRHGYDLTPTGEIRNVVRDGATWGRVESRRISVAFHQLEEVPVFVEARIRGLGSRQATVRIDGKYVGTLRFRRDEVQVVSTSTTSEPLSAGNHVVSLQFHGTKRDTSPAEVGWIRIGVPDEDPRTFAAPTLRDLAVEAAMGGQPHRALALRGPGRVRCAFTAREDMRLQTTLGYVGPGEGEARIKIVEPGKPGQLLHAVKLGGEGKDTEVVDVSLEGFSGRIVALDLMATMTSPGGRILFGDPMLRVREPRIPDRLEANVVVVVVFTGANRNQIPSYEDQPSMPAMTAIAEEAVVFHQHRAPTTVTTGSVATLLTGVSPAVHRIMDTGARLPERFATVGTIARDKRVATSMFTGNPMTFEAFGFDRGWDRFTAHTPVSGTAAGAPLREAVTWVDDRLKEDRQRPLLVVVHARGGHPPWTGSAEELKDLPPKDYAGNLNSRRGGQILAKERHRRFGRKPMSTEDRIRTDAFARLGLSLEDALLGQLVEILKHHKVWDSTLLVLTSDVAMGGRTRIPFGDGESLGEDILEIPLIARFPGAQLQGMQVRLPTTVTDVSRTILASLDLEPLEGMQGRNLLEIAAYPGRFGTEPQFAFLENTYATRWGNWLMVGRSPRQPNFCEVSPDNVGCSKDESLQNPLYASWMWRMTYRHLRESEASWNPRPIREPATLDADTIAALTVWGNLEPKKEKE